MQRTIPTWLAVCLTLYLLLGSRDTTMAETTPDPGRRGPFAVSHDEYTYGDEWCTFEDGKLRCPDIPCGLTTPEQPPPVNSSPVELTASVYYPEALSKGPFPLVIFLHGGHVTCYEGKETNKTWPCKAPQKAIPSYQGFEYVGDLLASHGYIVVSISANGIKAGENKLEEMQQFEKASMTGRAARAQLIQKHLQIWEKFNQLPSCAPFLDRFQNKVALDDHGRLKVGTMGHSLGGEGVVEQFRYNRQRGSPYDVEAVMTLAPVYSGTQINQVPFAVLLSYCDGDPKGNLLVGVRYFDDAWYNDAGKYQADQDTSPRHMILVLGANHNYYNTTWTPGRFPAGAVDDWVQGFDNEGTNPYCGSVAHRLTPAQQRDTAAAYVSGFFRVYLGGESAFRPILTGDVPPPPSTMSEHIYVSYHPPFASRRDINRLLQAQALQHNNLCVDRDDCGRVLITPALHPYTFCERGGDPRCMDAGDVKQPELIGLSQLRVGWKSTAAWYENTMPTGEPGKRLRDVSGFHRLQFRVNVDFASGENPKPSFPLQMPQDFRITLTSGTAQDNNKKTASILVSEAYRNRPNPLYYPPGTPSEALLSDRMYPIPKDVLNMVSLPLSAFQEKGVDLTDIHTIAFEFPANTSGMLFLSAIAFSR